MQNPRLLVSLSLLLALTLSSAGLRAQDDQPAARSAGAAAAKKLTAASGLYQGGLYKLAAESYSDFLQEYPAHPQRNLARYGLGICRYQLGQYDRAIKLLQQVVAEKDFPQRDEALVVLGYCLMQAKSYDQALETFRTLGKDYPDSKQAAAARLNEAQLLYTLGKYPQAQKACESFLTDNPKSPSRDKALYWQALSLRKQDKHGQVVGVARELTENKQGPYYVDALLLLGQAQQATGRNDQAVQTFREMVAAAPDDRKLDARYSLALALQAAGKDAEAAELFSEISGGSDDRYPSARYKLALAQWRAGKIDQARKSFRQVADARGAYARDALYWIARCDLAEGKALNARKILLALRDGRDDDTARIDYALGLCSMALGEYGRAAKEFQTFLQTYPEAPQRLDATYRRAYCLFETGQLGPAIELASKAAETAQGPLLTALLDLQAEALFRQAKYAQAAEVLETLRPRKLTDQQVLRIDMRLGQCQYQLDQYDKAVATLTPLAQNKKVLADLSLHPALLALGDALVQAGQYDRARAVLDTYLSVSQKQRPRAQYYLAIAQLRNGQADDAARSFKQVIEGKDTSPWVQRALLEYGQMKYRGKELDEAGELLDRLTAADPPAELAAPAVYLQGWVRKDQQKYPEALKSFSRFVTTWPEHGLAVDASLQQAICTMRTGDHEAAGELFAAWLEANQEAPQRDQARRLYTQCLLETKKHRQAAEMLDALAENPQTVSAEVLYDLAWARKGSAEPDGAIAAYRTLLEKYPEDALSGKARLELADMLYAAGDFKEAADHLKPIVLDQDADDPTRAAAQYRLAWCYEKLDEPAQAASAFESFAAAWPEHESTPSALYQGANTYMAIKKYDQAIAMLRTLVEKHPDNPLARQGMIRLAQAQADAGQFAPSQASYRVFLAKYPDDSLVYLARFGMGWALENQGKYDQARTWYAKVIDTHQGPTAARAQYRIGQTYLAQRNFSRAAREFIATDTVYGGTEWAARALLESGTAFTKLGKLAQARSQYDLLIRKYPDTAPARSARKRLEQLTQ